MALIVVFAALLGGVIGHFEFGGRLFSFSWIDGLAVVVFIAGMAQAWRRRRLRVDYALIAYGGILATVALQIAVFDGVWDLVGGSTRFGVPALLVAGLGQLLADDAGAAGAAGPRGWPVAFGAFGSVLGVWVVVQFTRGFLDPANDELYEIKNAVTVPMGASNYLAAFLLVSLAVCAVFAWRDRRYLLPTALASLGLLATLSRGAALSLVAVAAGVAVVRRARWALVALACVVITAAGVGLVSVRTAGDGAVGTDLRADAGAVLGPPTQSEDVAEGGSLPAARNSRLTGVIGDVPGRLHLYRSAWFAIVGDPLLGVGMTRIEETNAVDGVGHPNVHNMLLQSLVAVGVLGTIGYLGLYVLLVRRILALRNGTARLALGTALAALVLHAQVEALAFTRAIEVVVAVMLLITGHATGVGVRTFRRRESVAATAAVQPASRQPARVPQLESE